jgi:predicted NAD/FAD-binding protein
VLAEMRYTHPILDRRAVEAQSAIEAINGARHTFYCGAHLRYGFHEDGLWSALNVARRFGGEL